VDKLVVELEAAGAKVSVNRAGLGARVAERGVLRVNYLGNCRDRGSGALTALGMNASGDWAIEFSLDVLRGWFGAGIAHDPTTARDYYAMLGATPQDDAATIKRLWRQAARTWHPDVTKDPDAGRIFIALNEAWDILKDDKKRARYDLGLRLMQTQNAGQVAPAAIVYVPALRCGWVDCEYEVGVRYVVRRILDWRAIVEDGKTLFTTWANNMVQYDWR
jgi:hypothetical protein